MRLSSMFVVLSITVLVSEVASFDADAGVFGKIKSGFEMAGKFLGLDQARGVAQLVSSAFAGKKSNRKGDHADYKNDIFSGFLRVLGFDSKRIGAIAVNAIIFVAQLITSSLTTKKQRLSTHGRNLDPTINLGTPLEWALQSDLVTGMMTHIHQTDLPTQIIEKLREESVDEESGCVQLLVCKSAPLVAGMQRALKASTGMKRGKEVFYEYVPSMSEMEENGSECEDRYPYCEILI